MEDDKARKGARVKFDPNRIAQVLNSGAWASTMRGRVGVTFQGLALLVTMNNSINRTVFSHIYS